MDTPKFTAQPYKPALRCIYCGDIEIKNLTDEHIIPYSLGGMIVLKKSSCRKCADITKRYEQTVARDVFGKFRVKHNIQTRNKKERPKSYIIGTIKSDYSGSTIEIPAKIHPSPLFIYKFSPANILYGLSQKIDTFLWVPYCAATTDPQELVRSHGWDGKLQIRPVPIEFARMLAKISHSYATAELGMDSFYPLALDIILCKTDNVSYLVGGNYTNPTGSTDDLEPPVENAGHTFNMTYRHVPNHGILLVCEIRLFASLSTPTYHVVIGKVVSQRHHDILKHKIIASTVN